MLRLDGSLSVQGPPGTGKTYVGSHVIRRWSTHGWRVGVVSQSHAAVNHMLDKVVEAGVPAAQVGKAKKRPDGAKWTLLEGKGKDKVTVADFLADARERRVRPRWHGLGLHQREAGRPRRALDLLVVDEAGQYSLANTIAVSVVGRAAAAAGRPAAAAAGEPGQRTPSRSTSALRWAGCRRARPCRPSLGYFLDRTWRMHPQI